MSISNYFSLASRVGNAFESYVIYIHKMLWPAALAPFYPHPAGNISIIYSALAAAVLSGITVLVVRFGKIHKYLPVGWFWYLGVLVPVIGLVQVGEQAFADRYSYVAMIGIGRVDEAIQCFEKAIRIKPNVYPSYVNLGLALTDKGEIRRGHFDLSRDSPEIRYAGGSRESCERIAEQREQRRGH